MGILWPGFLLLLAIVPVIVIAYIWMQRRRRRYAVRYSSLSLVRAALPQQSRWRRHLPFALFTLALASLVVAFGRPFATVSLPTGESTVMLSIDVSRSMCSIDIKPNRLAVAKDAALSFIKRQKSNVQIGIVAFAGYAELIQAPTHDENVLEDAIHSLITGHRTAIGSGILASVDALAEVNKDIPPTNWGDTQPGGPTVTPVPNGYYDPDIIVLLSDGSSNSGPLPIDAAQQAADRGIRVFTIGFGTEDGSIMDCGDNYLYGGMFGGGGQGFGGGNEPFGGAGGWFQRGIDEPTLMQVAQMTGAKYYPATSASELNKVFADLPITILTRTENQEISFIFAAAGALLAAAAILLSLLWHPLP